MRFTIPRLVSIRGLAATLALALWLPACGDSDPEARLEAAGEALSEARAEVQEARESVEQRKAAVTSAEEELAEARERLKGAEAQLAEVEQRVDLRATDAAVFRAVQQRLLEDESLEEVAIAARVERGVVTLLGQVPEAEQRERAGEIARGTPGVVAVENRIDVASPPAE